MDVPGNRIATVAYFAGAMRTDLVPQLKCKSTVIFFLSL